MGTSTIAAGLIAAVLLVGGCGSSPGTSTEPVSQTGTDGSVDAPNPDGDQPSADGEVDAAAGDDQTSADGEVDAPNPGGDQPSADLPGLPIGGQVPDTPLTTTDTSGCGTVAWVGPDELIPDGIEVAISEFHLPDGVSVDDTACAGAGPSCLGGVSFRADQTSCSLGVRWNGETPSTSSITADGTAYCDSQDTCDQFASGLTPQSAFLVIEVSEPEEDVTSDGASTDDASTDDASPDDTSTDDGPTDDGDPLVSPSMTPSPDGTE